MRLADKKIMITAAASGMGRAGVDLFTREGATVAAVDRDGPALERLVDEVTAAGGKVEAFVADLSDAAATGDVFDRSVEWLGGLDGFWSHAGMPGPSDVEDFDLDHFRTVTDLNITQHTILSGRAVTAMKENGSGSIVFTSSAVALVGSLQSPVYSSVKAALVGLTKGLAVRYATDGIRVNSICPSMVATPMLYNDFMKSDGRFTKEETEARFVSAIPMGRPGRPEEIAHAALWLLSDDASFVTGIAMPVDGGLVAR
ncbi:SDR family NAD(P)-dependent oxidoreductase [Gordonia humi]|uniref:NAD(P)-dependent dehydrogenase (Short-subunit alcohol dehydrogenase family) n=1 Tax=Gordonia humi TaxID=686429 RepID=A0A840EXB8_9ACTN|nr:SDR family NAD(P)-dependent oxidoreductase [Gordonia humi]MBB4133569.1 NAD(P)-dependent dehydrogenase (short-subunit alcohol dehydrogenase family) [Gordonia humi]